ncbi:hypothetical protein BDV12DRAFT_202174 [Aspergillus spectabilis]
MARTVKTAVIATALIICSLILGFIPTKSIATCTTHFKQVYRNAVSRCRFYAADFTRRILFFPNLFSKAPKGRSSGFHRLPLTFVCEFIVSSFLPRRVSYNLSFEVAGCACDGAQCLAHRIEAFVSTSEATEIRE